MTELVTSLLGFDFSLFSSSNIDADSQNPRGSSVFIEVHTSTRRHPTHHPVRQDEPILRIEVLSFVNRVVDYFSNSIPIVWMYPGDKIFERDFSRSRPSQKSASRIGSPHLIVAQVPFPNSQISRIRSQTHAFLAFAQSLLLVYQFSDVHTCTDIAGELSLRVIARDAVVRNPAILAIISPQPILHKKRLACVERLTVNLETFLQIIGVHAFSPAISEFFLQRATCKL